jgi:hypothetical protein
MRQNVNGNYQADKDPGEVLDYGFDWSKWLQAGENIISSNWVGDVGLAITGAGLESGLTFAFAGGGTIGQTLAMKNTIVTSAGRTAVRSIHLVIKQR